MKIEIIGKFYDNQSLSIVNRNIALQFEKHHDTSIIALDRPDVSYKVPADTIDSLLKLEKEIDADIQIRHSYPPIWNWPNNSNTKVVYIQPWEFSAIPSEWQYKFDTFADAVIVPSEWNANSYKNAGIDPEKIFVVPNGYNESLFNTDNLNRTTTTRFLYVGCNQFRKGLDVLLKVWSSITKRDENIELVIKDTPQVYGKTNLQQDIIILQHRTKCAKITYSDDAMSEEEVSNLYKSCDIVVHPYRGEGFGMHIQEAVACGCVPIVTGGGPTDEFTNNYKIASSKRVVNPYEIFALKQGDSMSSMGQHRWVLEPNANDLANLIRKALANKGEPVDSSRLTTWEQAGKKYIEVLNTINLKQSTRRVR